MLYQVAAGILPPGLIAPTLRRVIKDQDNAHALLAEVQELNLDTRTVVATAPDGRPIRLPYDTLVVAAEDARFLRHRTLLAFEMAELATDPRNEPNG